MANIFRALGRLTGQAFKSQTFDRTLSVTAGYVASEMRLTDIRVKRGILRRKHANHLRLLGKTVYRLMKNGVDPFGESHVDTIIRVLKEIEGEIAAVEEELKKRRQMEETRRKSHAHTGEKKSTRSD